MRQNRKLLALAELCQTYWTPLYTFVRTRGYSVYDAQDLTQSFFAHFIEQEIYARTEPTKGWFRAILQGRGRGHAAGGR